jgi:hypothetical protein
MSKNSIIVPLLSSFSKSDGVKCMYIIPIVKSVYSVQDFN